MGLRSQGGAGDDLFLTGTALPDFASMARVRLLSPPGQLGDGISLHHATDHVFHADTWFLGLEQHLRRLLVRAGLPDGGARACAHVGPELLLDGALVTDPTVASAVDRVYARIAVPDPALVDVAVSETRPGWADHLARIAKTLDPHLYMDPTAVGQLLWRIAGRRPRLAFDARYIPAVVAALAEVQPHIALAADEVVGGVVAATRRNRVTR